MTEPASPIKCILILLDGVADRAHAKLGHQTPLQAAATPNLDELAALGANGLYHAARPGVLPALDRIRNDDRLLVVVTGDHSTPSSGQMTHSGEPSPLIIAGLNVWRDADRGFDEIQCAGGALGTLLGKDLLHYILSLLDRGKLWGLRDSRFDVPFFPGPRTPFSLDGLGQSDNKAAP